jgi:hypothetical protein
MGIVPKAGKFPSAKESSAFICYSKYIYFAENGREDI